MTATVNTALKFDLGQKVEAGKPGTENYDTGRVLDVRGDQVYVGWQSGVNTWQPASLLRDAS